MSSSTCPCCANPLLRHIRSREIYWFCGNCYLEMPNYGIILNKLETNAKLSDYSSLTKVNPFQHKVLAL